MDIPAKPLPRTLASRYRGWHATEFAENAAWYGRLADEGQRPRSMVISCCDSRVHVTSLFGADRGEFFIHRNIANLVPPYKPDGDLHGTSAALEYAVCGLSVTEVLVLGHSNCGGVEGGLDLHENDDRLRKSEFVSAWLELIRPGFDRLPELGDRAARLRALEHETVLVSLGNLMTFPFVAEGVSAGTLSLHGLWHDIGTGELEVFDPGRGGFVKV